MKTLLCIHSYPGARDRVWKLWPFYKVPGWPIMGFDCEDGQHDWPENTPHVGCGLNKYMDASDNLARKLIGTLEFVLNHRGADDVTDICVIEHDAIFIRKPPVHPGGILTTLAVYPPPQWGLKCKAEYHTPWWVDRDSAAKIVEAGKVILTENLRDSTTPDAFIGLCIDRSGIPVHLDKTWSVNSGNIEFRREGCAKAIKDGAWYLHGIKSEEDFAFVNGVLRQTPGTFCV